MAFKPRVRLALPRRLGPRHPPSRIGREPSQVQRGAVPLVTVMIGSMLPILPHISTVPMLPPGGLVMFLAWRTLHRNIWLPWIALPLGFWDDLFSGAHIGTAMLLWTVILLGMDMLDRRLMWRDARQEWAIAAALLAGFILLSRMLGGGDMSILGLMLAIPQALLAALLFPLAVRMCDAIDVWRLRL